MLKSAQNLENLFTIVQLNQVFLQENWVMGLKRHLRQSANDLHLAEIPEKTRGFITLIPKKSWITSLEHRIHSCLMS